MDISKLVEEINAGIKNSGRRAFAEKIYTDVPIIRTAASLPGGDPPEYRMLRKLGNTLGYSSATEARIFYEQAKYMERFTDDCPYEGDFTSYYPTYRSMSLAQLRGYFTWRTKLRAGEYLHAPTPYAYVYVYELINQIGCADEADGLEKMLYFSRAYRSLEPTQDRYMRPWLRDYVVYYDLPREYLSQAEDLQFDIHLRRLMCCEDFDDAGLFESLSALSSFRPENSRFYKDYTADFQAVVCRVYRAMSGYFQAHRKTSYCESLFGRLRALPCTMFSAAVFYDRDRYRDRRYEISPFHAYVCSGGKWICYRCAGGTGKSTELGAFLRNLDSMMRKATDYPYETKTDGGTKQFAAVAKKEIDAYFREKKEAERRRVDIDFSVLDSIRAAADETREKLMTEEEMYAEDAPAEAPPAVPDASPAEDAPLAALNPEETAFLKTLLEGGDPLPALKAKGLLPSVTAEAVNEKLFDTFMDTIIDFDGDKPQIVSFYEEDVRGLFA